MRTKVPGEVWRFAVTVGESYGVKEGGVILGVAGRSVANSGDMTAAVKSAQAGNKNSVLTRVRSAAGSHYVTFPLAEGCRRTKRGAPALPPFEHSWIL